MKAVIYGGPGEVRVEDVPDPRVIDPDDAVVGSRRRLSAAPTFTSSEERRPA